jgi:PAS domain-containing protein
VRRKTSARKTVKPKSKTPVLKAKNVSAPEATHFLLESGHAVLFSYRYAGAYNHGFSFVSAKAKAVVGVSAAALMKNAGALRLHPDDVDQFNNRVLGAMAKGEEVNAQIRVLQNASEVHWVQLSAWLQSKKNRVSVYNGIVLDIDAHKLAEADTIKILERMEHAQDIAKLGWYDLNVQDRVIDLTSEFADNLGLPFAPGGHVTGVEADKYREAFLNAIHPEDRERYMSIISDPSWRRIEFDYRVLTRTNEETGEKEEPFEEVLVDVDEGFTGVVVEKLSIRKAQMQDMRPSGGGKIRITFIMPSRGLIGYHGEFLTDTRGTGIMNRLFAGYQPWAGNIEGRVKGSLISNSDGEAVQYALFALQERGTLFVNPGEKVYQGLILGEHSRGSDLEVNPIKEKKLTNVRASGKDEAIRLTPPRRPTLEQAIAYIDEDELVEVTPKSIRLRKKELNPSFRKKRMRQD